jgi:tetratricopeptide (TPR) repeat protein
VILCASIAAVLFLGGAFACWYYWESTQSKSPGAHLLGGLAVEEKSPQEAIWHYTRAIEKDPQCALAYALRGKSKHDAGDSQAALKDLDRAVAFGGATESLARLHRGVVLRGLGEVQRALEDHNRAIELDPEFAPAYAQRGGDRLAMGEFVSAIKDYRHAVTLDPEFDLAHIGLASILANCTDKKLRNGAEAVVHARQACELTDFRLPHYVEILSNAYDAAGKPEQAAQYRRLAARLRDEIERAP